ncbi:O-methyltransferase [Mycobacterium sp.]|uniref:O-methyltransferase n=1 Tax=Mycobacterium sp. TaxID=1785 RepID=UPI003C720E69
MGRVSEPNAVDVDALFDRLLIGDDPALAATRAATAAAGMPPIEVSAQHGKFLYLLASVMRARRILEIGTLGGFSTIWLARAVGPEGHVVTLEYEPKHAQVARTNIDRAGVGQRVDVIVGAALDTLPQLRSESFDLVFVDADKENNSAYVQWAVELSAPGSIIVVDNVVRMGRVLAPAADDHQAQGVVDMLDMIAAHPRLEAAAVQTVGVKGWDGFLLARVT